MSESLPYECDDCRQCWGNPISASLCCSPLQDDPRDDGTPGRYVLGYD